MNNTNVKTNEKSSNSEIVKKLTDLKEKIIEAVNTVVCNEINGLIEELKK